MLNTAEHEHFSANMKMPAVVGIFIFVSIENFMLIGVEHEKSFITLGPEYCIYPKYLDTFIPNHTNDFISFEQLGPEVLMANSVD